MLERIIEDLNAIFTNGLKNTGDLSTGFISSEVSEPNRTVSNVNDIITATITLKTSYKDSQGGVLVCFPADIVSKQGEILPGCVLDVYDVIDGTYHIKPDYLLGYVAQENEVCRYHSKEEILNKKHQKIIGVLILS